MNIKISKLKSYLPRRVKAGKLQATSCPRAFTLIELMITIGIMVLVLVTALPAFRSYSYINELDRSADNLSSAIVETQTLALAPPTNKNKDHDSYKIEFTHTNNKYEYTIWSGIKSGDDLENDNASQQVKIRSNTLSNNVTISNISEGSSYIIYSIQDQGRISYPTTGTLELKLIHSKIDKRETVTVNLITGQVSVK